MAAPLFKGDTQIKIKGTLVSKPYIDITLDVMARFGITVEHDNYSTFIVKGAQQYQAVERIMVEGDASSASYFIAAAAIAGGEIEIKGVGAKSVQGDIGFANVMEQVGAKIDWYDERLVVRKGELNGIDIDANAIPDSVMDMEGNVLYQSLPRSSRAVDEQAAWLTTYAMKQGVAQGTGPPESQARQFRRTYKTALSSTLHTSTCRY